MIAEYKMLLPLESYLHRKGFRTAREVPLLTKRIDLVGISNGRLVAIEVKVKNWQRALQQALCYKLCAHEAYIALCREFVHRADKKILQRYGIGIIGVDGTAEIVMPAEPSSIIHDSLLTDVFKYIEKQRE